MTKPGYRVPTQPIHAPVRVRARAWAEYVDVREPDECWPWKASVASHGYGQIGWQEDNGRWMMTAHRVIWESLNGPIPVGMTVDHACRNSVCVNPNHLRLLSNVENARDNRQAMRGPGLRSYKEVI